MSLTEKEQIGYSIAVSDLDYKQLKHRGELLTIIKLGDSYIPFHGNRSLAKSIKQGKKDIEMHQLKESNTKLQKMNWNSKS